MLFQVITRLCFLGLLAGAAILITPCPASAIFVKTSQGGWQHTNEKHKVFVTRMGIFIINGRETEFQVFDPKRIPTKGSTHVFLEFDDKSNKYRFLHVGSKKYSVKGSFTLYIGSDRSLRLTVDSTAQNPFSSIVSENKSSKKKEDPDILAILGSTMVANSSGLAAVAILEANKFNKYHDVMFPYTIDDKGQLTLKGRPIITNVIGLDLKRLKDPCLSNPKTVYLRKEEIKEIKKLSADKAKKKINAILARNKKEGFQDLLALKVETNATVALSFAQERVYVIRPVSKKQKKGKNFLCVVDELDLKDMG